MKIAKEVEKARVKEEAKVRREETKAAKKDGVKIGALRYRHNNEWVVTQPDDKDYAVVLSQAEFLCVEHSFTETGWEPIAGVTHRVEVEQTVNLPLPASIAGSIPAAPTNVPACGDPTCTARSHEQCKHLLDSLPEGCRPHTDDTVFIGGAPCTFTSPTSETIDSPVTKSDSTDHMDSLKSKASTSTKQMQPSEFITSMEETRAIPTETPKAEPNVFIPPFKLPMEG